MTSEQRLLTALLKRTGWIGFRDLACELTDVPPAELVLLLQQLVKEEYLRQAYRCVAPDGQVLQEADEQDQLTVLYPPGSDIISGFYWRCSW